MAYLYNYVGKPEKTNEKVKYILDNFYTNTPDGLIGNEDCGQMSAWYVLSAMGIYNVSPGNIEPSWSTTEPYFENIKVNFENKTSKIITKNMDLSSFGLEIIKRELFALPERITPVPIIQAESKAFKDKLKIELKSQNSNDVIFYTTNDATSKLDDKIFIEYTKPFSIDITTDVFAYVENNGQISNTISAQFFKKPNNYSINIKSKYNPQYHAGGSDGLLDGILGTENWRKGDWQGYQSQDFEAVVDLQEVKSITEISARFLQDQRSWILMPTKVEYYISDDNVNFTYFGSVNNTLDPKIEENIILNYTANENKKARYVKVIAKNFGKLPEWHQGAGGDAFIFVDEITVK
jgi:hypothetical protein